MSLNKKIPFFCKGIYCINGNIWRSFVSALKDKRSSQKQKMSLAPHGIANLFSFAVQLSERLSKSEPFVVKFLSPMNNKFVPNWADFADVFLALPSQSRSLLQPKSVPKLGPRTVTTAGPSRMKNSMIQNNNGMVITLDTVGFVKENITVEVEENWLVVEALATAAQPGEGGYLQRHMMRRFELHPLSDTSNIKIELNEETNQLVITVPRKKPTSFGGYTCSYMRYYEPESVVYLFLENGANSTEYFEPYKANALKIFAMNMIYRKPLEGPKIVPDYVPIHFQ